jgi:hypothetical protein
MRLKGYFRKKPYLITDRLRSGDKVPIEGVILKIQDLPKVYKFKNLQEAKDWVRENEK